MHFRFSGRAEALLYVTLCILFWAMIPVVSKTGQSHLDNHQFLFWSSTVSLGVFVIITVLRNRKNKPLPMTFQERVRAAVLGFLGTYLYYILLYYGYARTKGIEVLIIQYFWPLFVVILSVPLLGEKITIRKSAAALSGFAGIFLVLTKGRFSGITFNDAAADAAVFGAAFIFGLFSVLSKKTECDLIDLVTVYFLTASAASFISMMVMSEFRFPDFKTLLPVVFNGVFVNGISYVFWLKAMKKGGASFIAPFVFLTPVISTMLLVVFFREPFLPAYAAGLAVVLAGGFINRKQV